MGRRKPLKGATSVALTQIVTGMHIASPLFDSHFGVTLRLFCERS
jgi:hypothetical protein